MYSNKLENKKILIVEDDFSSYQLLLEFFSRSGAKIIYSDNGKDAVNITKKINDIDIILMDIKLPEKSGICATKEIREFNKEIPIIAQTASVLKEEIENYTNSGMTDFISKPYKQKDIIDIVTKYLS